MFVDIFHEQNTKQHCSINLNGNNTLEIINGHIAEYK